MFDAIVNGLSGLVAGQFGIFLTIGLALFFGFPKLDAVAIGIIGACDGPAAIYVTSKYAPHLLGAVSVAAYSYMSLVPVIQPPIMKLMTSQKERILLAFGFIAICLDTVCGVLFGMGII
jgi:Na+-transporting methylmalonyl-CoA/oxaloacetate decarboxylase beta subunit